MNNPLKDFRPESLCLLKETQEDYWCYARKGPHDFSVYTEKSSIYETPTKEKFRESTDVLVRWTDGLLYLATIIQVEDEYSRCAVKFEDGSQFWALYKDIYKGPSPENEFACTVCDSSYSQPPDEIVICDKCSVGYHQLCHIPKIATADLNPEIPWSCRKCVFASAAKKGGASKKGSNAQAMLMMKETLPYNLEALTWDTSHRSNLQQTYCYCGGPGEWYSKMLQCTRCKQWFHEACIQCLDDPLLYGDRFYIFVCTACNKGPEFLRRLPLRWPDIAHLVLFNLTVIHGKKFFEFDTTIMSFLKDNWSQFQIKGESLSRMPSEEKRKKMLEHLQNSKSRFTSGKEMKRKTAVWGLRSRVPPTVPVVTLPESGVITNDVLDSFNASSRKRILIKSNSIKEIRNTSVPVKRPRKLSMRDSETVSDISSRSVSKSEKCVQPSSQEEKSKRALQLPKKKEKRKLPHRLAKCPKPNRLRKARSTATFIDISESEDTSSSHDTLNSIIPHPTNFEGMNNPFLSNYKLSSSEPPEPTSLCSRTEPKNEVSNRNKHCLKLRVRPSRKYTSNKASESVINHLLNDSPQNYAMSDKCKSTAVAPPSSSDLSSSVSNYFGMADRIANGEKFSVLAKRTGPDGKVQYLVEWECLNSS
ncbi:metal-response element-binding transcription factor 2 [Trichonephila inaurata madagascariensis]|uniref:Metal-response element-binding transcription factor 2 n=1 Tax=Trichonephila inaurata madagascariensis TaxID=2747483 RepID=A0A8X6WPR1_9ARAC|nr:metal-response element-binding transcription factor 2 [Trichonephila inaurata madagascariensis]